MQALPARIAALRSGDAAAVAAALRALAAPAYALPPPHITLPVSHHDANTDGWQIWIELALAAHADGLSGALAPLLRDERFTDAALALCVPLLAALGYDEETHEECLDAGLAASLTALLEAAEAATRDGNAGASVDKARLARVLRALSEYASLGHDDNAADEDALARPSVVAALLALMRRTPDSADDLTAGGAAGVILHLRARVAVPRAAVLSAALCALPAAVSVTEGVRAYGGYSGGRWYKACLLPACILSACIVIYSSDEQPLAVLLLLLQAQPAALAALARCGAVVADWTREWPHLRPSKVLKRIAQWPAQQDAPQLAGSACRGALLDTELSLSELLSPAFAPRDVQALFLAACTDDTAQEVLAHAPEAARLAAAASTALLAPHSPPLAALLAQGGRVRLLARTYVRACAVAPWRLPRLPWHVAAALRLRHERLAAAVAAAAVTAGLAHDAPPPEREASPPRPKRKREGGVSLAAPNVNERRYDSVTLLVGGAPLYVCGLLMESASPLLADLLSGVAAAAAAGGPLPPVVLPAPADVSPDALHTLCCAAVEHTYTGHVGALPQASLLPLWCVARHLQLDALQAFCELRLAPVLRAERPLLVAAAGVAARHKSDALLQRVAAALLAVPAECCAGVEAVLGAAAGGGDDAARGAASDALADAMTAVIQEALLLLPSEDAADA